MAKPRLLLSVTNDTNDYQIEQVQTARQAAAREFVDLVYAQDDGILQSQHLLDRIQSTSASRPSAIIFEPAGATVLPHVARVAAAAGIGWVVLSRDADYIGDLRSSYQVPAFVVTADHVGIGRTQGRQLAALVPQGGIVLHLHGPAHSEAARLRHVGLLATKPENIQLRVMKAQWSEASAHRIVRSWLELPTSRATEIAAVCAQDDSMAMGARKAFEESVLGPAAWQQIPFLGCDGMPITGQEWVRRGLLAATVLSPPTAPVAIELIARFLRHGTMPPDCTLTETKSIPDLETLTRKGRAAAAH
jgi:ribose transport system substrate-binding protein